ncbi:hypothetical protein F7O44_17525 [Phytoactinopolyspora sp. XMNu-373]|uniref:Abi family protein n=1 Tax=Phytoactinopolyspora mesophila TaxID=2650750 RepID=A0A7K3M6C7_9ACTN|nr:hypothetical protein [Phytoactinopolyspora mesophila]
MNNRRPDGLERALSRERLSPYRTHVGGDLQAAISLYEWNATISAAFWLDLSHIEVLVRNAMHAQLTAWCITTHGHDRWFDDPGRVLTQHHREDILTARKRLKRTGKQADPGRIVAELSFGFWRYLVASQYDRTLWKPVLRHGFPHQPRRRPLHDCLTRLHRLRNRIAHHEPVYRMPLEQHLADLKTLARWVDPDLCAWITSQSEVAAIFTERPA